MTTRLPPVPYVLNVGAALPKRWRDHIGPLRVLAGPVEGFVMLRRRGAGCAIAIRLSVLLNAEADPTHGPFECISEKRKGRA